MLQRPAITFLAVGLWLITTAHSQQRSRLQRRGMQTHDYVLDPLSWEPTTTNDPMQYIAAVPWLDKGTPKPYHNLHNDLDALLKVQASPEGIITWTFFTRPWRAMLMNMVYSLVRYGKVNTYIVYTLDEASLQTCLGLNLPCYNASSMNLELAARIPANDLITFQDPLYRELTFWKPTVTHDLLKRGYWVHFADPDCVFVKNAYRSLVRSLELHHADGTAMRELFGINAVNLGHYMLRNTSLVMTMMDMWNGDNGQRAGSGSEQGYFHTLKGTKWEVCYNGYNCTKYQRVGSAAIHAYVEQATGWWGEQCLNHHKYWHCAEHAMVLHFMCIDGGMPEKITWMEKYNVWFVHNITSMEAWTQFQQEGHPWLPCKDDLAWRNWALSLAYGAVW